MQSKQHCLSVVEQRVYVLVLHRKFYTEKSGGFEVDYNGLGVIGREQLAVSQTRKIAEHEGNELGLRGTKPR